MRLWHKDLISVLPRQQLLSQWRECCCIARNIAIDGTPKHLLVDKVLEYSKWHFCWYTKLVVDEMRKRGYNVNTKCFDKWIDWINGWDEDFNPEELFEGWHNDRYLAQCYFNLQEKYDCGGMTKEEWKRIQEKFLTEYRCPSNVLGV